MRADDDNAAFTRDVGHPVTLAIQAFGEGNYAETVRLLRPIRGDRPPLRRQPCAARRDRPDADRGGVARRRHALSPRACGRAVRARPDEPAVAAVREPGRGGVGLPPGRAIVRKAPTSRGGAWPKTSERLIHEWQWLYRCAGDSHSKLTNVEKSKHLVPATLPLRVEGGLQPPRKTASMLLPSGSSTKAA